MFDQRTYTIYTEVITERFAVVGSISSQAEQVAGVYWSRNDLKINSRERKNALREPCINCTAI